MTLKIFQITTNCTFYRPKTTNSDNRQSSLQLSLTFPHLSSGNRPNVTLTNRSSERYKKGFHFSVKIFSLILSDPCKKNLSRLVEKISTFIGRTLPVLNPPLDCTIRFYAAALSLNIGPISKMVVPISHLDTKTFENSIQVEKYQSHPLIACKNTHACTYASGMFLYLRIIRASQNREGGVDIAEWLRRYCWLLYSHENKDLMSSRHYEPKHASTWQQTDGWVGKTGPHDKPGNSFKNRLNIRSCRVAKA